MSPGALPGNIQSLSPSCLSSTDRLRCASLRARFIALDLFFEPLINPSSFCVNLNTPAKYFG
jgi:hypothetical protein